MRMNAKIGREWQFPKMEKSNEIDDHQASPMVAQLQDGPGGIADRPSTWVDIAKIIQWGRHGEGALDSMDESIWQHRCRIIGLNGPGMASGGP